MAAYIVVEIDVTDPENYEEYKRRAPASIAEFGGRYLARGGKCQALEGGWEPQRLVILEFPTAERARAWWESGSYAEPRALRQRTARTRMVLIPGI
jgi:uncharacterized protein (DUF1330 family)